MVVGSLREISSVVPELGICGVQFANLPANEKQARVAEETSQSMLANRKPVLEFLNNLQGLGTE